MLACLLQKAGLHCTVDKVQNRYHIEWQFPRSNFPGYQGAKLKIRKGVREVLSLFLISLTPARAVVVDLFVKHYRFL